MNVLEDTSGAQLSRLESLPAALLVLVFDRVETETHTTQLKPISKTLRPFLLRNQYRNIKIDYYHFLRLCDTVHDYHTLIKTIKITPGSFSSHSDWVSDYEVEHEKAIFDFCKAATSLEQFQGLNTHPRLQQRLLSARIAIHCFKSVRSFQLRFPADQDDENPALSNQTRYLACFPKLDRLAIQFYGERKGRFTSAEEKKFEEEDREEIKLAEFVHREWNPIGTLWVSGESHPDDLDVFAARFRQLLRLTLDNDNTVLAQAILECIEPSTLKTLVWNRECYEPQPIESSLGKFVSLESLKINGFAVSKTLVTSLSKLSQLKEISLITGSPPPSDILLLLDPLMRPPALELLDVWPPCYFDFNGQLHPITLFDPTIHGSIRPQWRANWTLQLAREVVSLAAQGGIRFGKAKDWAKSIATHAYLEARGDALDSDDGWTDFEISSESEEVSGSEDESGSEVDGGGED